MASGEEAKRRCRMVSAKPTAPGAFVVPQGLGAVELATHIAGYFVIKVRFRAGELVRHGVGDAFREQRRAVELQQVLLHHAPHQVAHVHGVNAVAESTLETVAVQQARKS